MSKGQTFGKMRSFRGKKKVSPTKQYSGGEKNLRGCLPDDLTVKVKEKDRQRARRQGIGKK